MQSVSAKQEFTLYKQKKKIQPSRRCHSLQTRILSLSLPTLRPDAQLTQGPSSGLLHLQAARPPTTRPGHQEPVRNLPGSQQERRHCLSCGAGTPRQCSPGQAESPPASDLGPQPHQAEAAAGFCPSLHGPHCSSILPGVCTRAPWQARSKPLPTSSVRTAPAQQNAALDTPVCTQTALTGRSSP